MSQFILKPTSTLVQGGFSVVGAATAHDAVDEGTDSHDGDSTYIQAGSFTTLRLGFDLPNTPITNIKVAMVQRLLSGGPQAGLRCIPRVNGVPLAGQSILGLTTSYSRGETSGWSGNWSVTSLELDVQYQFSPAQETILASAVELLLTPVGDLYFAAAHSSPVITPRPPIDIWPY